MRPLPTTQPGLDLVATLQTVVTLLSGAVDSEALLFQSVADSLDRLGLRGAVMTRADSSMALTVRAATFSSPTLERVERMVGLSVRGFRFDASQVDVLRTVMTTGRGVFVQDTHEPLAQIVPPIARPFLGLIRQAVESMPAIYVALRASGRVIGVLHAAGATMTPADLPALEGFAAGISMALDNIRLKRSGSAGVPSRDLVNEVLREALRGRSLDTTIEHTLEALVEVTHEIGGAAVALLDPVSGRVRRVFHHGSDERMASALGVECPAWGWPEWARRHDGLACAPCGEPHATSCGLRGVWTVPIADNERLYGMLAVATTSDTPRGVLEPALLPVANALASVVVKQEAEAERADVNARFLHAQRLEAVGQLAGGIAHDFNNLLTGIVLTATLVRGDLPDGSPLGESLLEIESACDRGARLTRQLLMFSRRQALTPQPVNLSSLVGNMKNLLSRILGEDVALRVERPGDDERWLVIADCGAIEQVLMNLAVNARDAMVDGGTLTLRVTHHGDVQVPAGIGAREDRREWICLAVADTGVGMDAETQAHMFEPFFTTKDPERGTGLGLSVVYGVVRDFGGWVDVESAPGRGTTFRVWLPRAGADAVSVVPDQRSIRAPRSGVTFLVVEDEGALGRSLVRVLSRAGYRSVLARTLADARDQMARAGDAFDGLLSDVVLPDGDGLRLASELRATRPELPVLLMSGYLDDKNHHAEIRERGFAFIGKPFRPDELLHRIGELLADAG